VREYREFHSDLLAHQDDEILFAPFMLGRIFEAVLKQSAPWHEIDRISRDSIRMLNDFLGHRPVPTLESRKHEPYAHEWVRPVPLYVRGAGAAVGPYTRLIEGTIAILEDVPPNILRLAHFAPHLMQELAMDPRA